MGDCFGGGGAKAPTTGGMAGTADPNYQVVVLKTKFISFLDFGKYQGPLRRSKAKDDGPGHGRDSRPELSNSGKHQRPIRWTQAETSCSSHGWYTGSQLSNVGEHQA